MNQSKSKKAWSAAYSVRIMERLAFDAPCGTTAPAMLISKSVEKMWSSANVRWLGCEQVCVPGLACVGRRVS